MLQCTLNGDENDMEYIEEGLVEMEPEEELDFDGQLGASHADREEDEGFVEYLERSIDAAMEPEDIDESVEPDWSDELNDALGG